MAEKQFDFIQEQDKIFMIEFTKVLKKMGDTYGGESAGGCCWGKHAYFQKDKCEI